MTSAFRIVILGGPRQSGKTTLLRLLQESHGGSWRSLDDDLILETALDDPREFVGYGQRPVIIDEIQRGGDRIILAIKYQVDRDNDPGQFVLAGSTRFLTVPTLSESLAGRAVFVDLWPLAAVERAGVAADIASTLVNSPRDLLGAVASSWSRGDYLELMCAGGYPEVLRLPSNALRYSWFDGYVRTVIQRDVQHFADIQYSAAMLRLLRLLAARTGSPVVIADLARTLEITQQTIRNYLTYLDIVYLTIHVPPWSTSLTTKAAKAAKTYISDPGLAAHFLDADADGLRMPGNPALGPLVETFVATELTKLLANQQSGMTLQHYRDRDGREIDFILEKRDGTVIGIEVKASSTVTSKDVRHLAWLRDKLGDRFAGGIVFHLGEHSLPFGERLQAVPVSALWEHATW
ncbi:ATP-binding protein [Pseudonocardiaceae bacterium YIM PH 21723]|nr:ATP-binding protein [Pseudonocardiaceae bacterium YIM PH 21723]